MPCAKIKGQHLTDRATQMPLCKCFIFTDVNKEFRRTWIMKGSENNLDLELESINILIK